MLSEITSIGFIIDGISKTGQRQYIHRTGLAVIKVKKSGFQFYTNHLRFSQDRREECTEIFKLIEIRLKELQGPKIAQTTQIKELLDQTIIDADHDVVEANLLVDSF